MSDSVREVSGLDVVIAAPGANQAKAEGVGALNAIGAAAVENADAMDRAVASGQKYMAGVNSMKGSIGQATQSVDGLTKAQAYMQSRIDSLAQAIAGMNRADEQSLQSVSDLIAVEQQLATQNVFSADQLQQLAQLQKGYTAAVVDAYTTKRSVVQAHSAALREEAELQGRVGAIYSENRAIVLGHAQALAIDAEMASAAAGATGVHNVQLGRLNMEAGTATGKLLGINTGLTRVVGAVGASVVGYGQMIALFAAISAATWIFEKLSGANDKVAKAQADAVKSLKEFNEAQAAGVGGKLAIDLELARKSAEALHAKLLELGADNSKGYGPGGVIQAFREAFGGQTLTSQVKERDALVARGQENLAAKFGLTTGAMALQIEKQRDLTAAQGQGRLALDLINARFEFQNAMLQHSVGHTDAERASLNALSALQRQAAEDVARASEAMRVADAKRDIQGQITKIAALNAAHGETSFALAAVTIQLDANAQKLTFASEHSREAAAEYGVMVDQLTAFRIEAAQTEYLDKYKEKIDQIADAGRNLAAAITPDIGHKFANALGTEIAGFQGTIKPAQIKEVKQEVDHLAQSIQKDLLSAVESFSRGGMTSFTALFSDVERMSHHMVEQLTADIERLRKAHKDTARDELAQSIAKFAGAAVSGGLIGYDIGQLVGGSGGSSGLARGAFAGAAGGALAGSSAGAWGAAIGGLTGAASGLLGAANEQRDAAERLREASLAFQTSLTSYAASTADSVTQRLVAIQAQSDAFWKQLNAIDPYQKRPDTAKQYQTITDTAEAQRQQVTKDFWDGITKSLNALNGPLGAYENSVAEVEKQYETNIASAKALRASQEQLDQIEKIRTETEARLKAAFEESILRQKEDLSVRQLAAQGQGYAAEQLRREIDARRELADAMAQGLSADMIGLIQLTQALEAQAAAAAQAKLIADTNAALAVRAASATGNTTLAAQLQQQIDQANELYDAQQKGLDAATIANIEYVQGLERVALAAQQAEQAMQRSVSWIQEQAGVFGWNSSQTLAAEAAAYGFTGLTDAQIQALYTQYAPGSTLTPEQQNLNAHIASFLEDERNAKSSASSATAGGASSRNTSNNVTVSDAQKLTETTGIEMADYLASINVHVASIDQKTSGRIAGPSFSGGFSAGVTNTGEVNITVEIGTVNVGASGMDPAVTGQRIGRAISAQLGSDFQRERLRLSPVRRVD